MIRKIGAAVLKCQNSTVSMSGGSLPTAKTYMWNSEHDQKPPVGDRWFLTDKKILLVKKKGLDELILPGGKPEGAETDVDALKRELKEELGVSLSSANFIGEFSDIAADRTDLVVVRLYLSKVLGNMSPHAEIEGYFWVGKNSGYNLSAVVKNKIFPFLLDNGLL